MYSIYKFLAYWIVYSAVLPQQRLATLTLYHVGDDFNFTCDVSKFPGLREIPDKDEFTAIALCRDLFQHNLLEGQILYYNPGIAKVSKDNNPPAHWLYQYSGRTRNTTQVSVAAYNLQCTDAGLYSCEVFLPDGELVRSSPENITVIAPLFGYVINIILYGDDYYVSTNYIGKNISLTCNATAYHGLLMIWKQTTNDSAIEKPATGEISNHHIVLPIFNTGCPMTRYFSVLEFQVQETDDGNTYYCILSNDTVEEARQNFTLRIYPFLPEQLIVTETHYHVGGTFNITCDVKKFPGLKEIPGHDYLRTLGLFRKTFMKSEDEEIFLYTPVRAKYDNNLPSQWLFNYSGAAHYQPNNRKTVTVVVTAVNVQCRDAGEYKCRAETPDTRTFFNKPINITVQAPISSHEIKINQHHGNDTYSSTNYAGETITLTCTVTGPPDLLVTWKQTAKDSSIENPVTGEISSESTSPSVVSTGCEQSNYTSQLEFKLQETDDGNTYYCIVSNDTGEQSRENFTIYTIPVVNSTSQPELQLENQTEPNSEHQPEPPQEPQHNHQPEPQPGSQPEPQPENKTEPQPESQSAGSGMVGWSVGGVVVLGSTSAAIYYFVTKLKDQDRNSQVSSKKGSVEPKNLDAIEKDNVSPTPYDTNPQKIKRKLSNRSDSSV